ncbi:MULTISPECIES: DUF488 domain-containing protein [Comamonas]|uniref:DUF488 family protein n=1 Tax=Comamonas avium TaxID=2762231 RepID=A0ABR8S6R8_9BURK|nr:MULTISPECIES: DUF488 family protein [Comamonas]MBD7959146.1 DUF488 family protein [Comamonas avium]
MALRIVQLGTPRTPDEGLRIGTVRRPPRGVPKTAFASRDFYDVWYPELSPEPETMALAQESHRLYDAGQTAEANKQWALFARQFHKQLAHPPAERTLQLLAALSHQTNFSVGCYCKDEAHCHRSILRSLLAARSANICNA